MIRVLLYLTIALLPLAKAKGQPFFGKVHGEEMGFGQSLISTILEDQQGFLWIGTYLGLFRFDGLQSVAFRPEKDNPNSMSSEFINQIYEDKSRFLWIATRNGLTRIDPTRKVFTRYKHDSTDPNSIPNNRIFDIEPYSDSTLLLSCDRSGLCEFNKNTGKVRRLNPTYITRGGDTLKEVWSLNVFTARQHTVFLQSSRGILLYNAVNNTLVEVRDSISGYTQLTGKRNFFCSVDSTIWFADQLGRLCKWIPYQSITFFGDSTTRSQIKSGSLRIIDFNKQYILVCTHHDSFLFDKETGVSQPFRLRDDQQDVVTAQNFLTCMTTKSGIVVLGLRQGKLITIDPLLQQFKFKKFMEPDPELILQISDIQDDVYYHTRYIGVFHDSIFFTEDLRSGIIST
ncbi:MAG TPA: two-component regulator propeller domain-containing protein, partial [Saprospiraceae bacterium]